MGICAKWYGWDPPSQSLRRDRLYRPYVIDLSAPRMKKNEGFILPHGNYRELLSYKKAKVVYDVTLAFCGRFLTRGDRTIDQMIQAARSGKQNILEGSKASGTSKETEVKLTNTARASLEELLDDYHDFLRSRKHRLWEKDSREAVFVRRLAAKAEPAYDDFEDFCETRPAEVVANIASCLIHQPTTSSINKSGA